MPCSLTSLAWICLAVIGALSAACGTDSIASITPLNGSSRERRGGEGLRRVGHGEASAWRTVRRVDTVPVS